MSLMDRFNVLSQSASDRGVDKAILVRAFDGATYDGFDNGSNITDVVCWDEGSQSSILFLDKDQKVLDFSWVDSESPKDWDWKSDSKLAGFFASCIAYAKSNGLLLSDVGCKDYHCQ